MALGTVVAAAQIGGKVYKALKKGKKSASSSVLASQGYFNPTVDVGPPLPPGYPGASTTTVTDKAAGVKVSVDADGNVTKISRACSRHRRKRLLTAQDKADIAFLRGNLGGGELGRSVITALVSKRIG